MVLGTSVTVHYRSTAPFPDNTRGFFYYHRPKGLPERAGEIRFRKVPTDDPKMLPQGSDLLLPHGVPWSLPLWYLAVHPAFTAFWESLIRDKLITSSLVEEFAKTSSRWTELPVQLTLRTPAIHALGQPFTVQIGHKSRKICIADDQGPSPITLFTPFANLFVKGEFPPTALSTRISLFVGQFRLIFVCPLLDRWDSVCAVVCIEHNGNNFVVRVLDIHEAYRDKIRTNVGDTHPLTFRARNYNPSIAYDKLLKMAEERRR